jgi:hypothetical protein
LLRSTRQRSSLSMMMNHRGKCFQTITNTFSTSSWSGFWTLSPFIFFSSADASDPKHSKHGVEDKVANDDATTS